MDMWAFESLAAMMPTLPDESVEGLLSTYTLLVTGDEQRPAAAQLLRSTAEGCTNPARRDRLMRAAEAIATGVPCELTEAEREAKRAVEAQTITAEEWEARLAESPLPPPPFETALDEEEEDQDEDEDEDDDSSYLDEPPPSLPHLRVPDFFPGLKLRIGQPFADAHGRAQCEGELVSVLNCDDSGEGCHIICLDRNIRVTDPLVIENSSNAWFQPVPTVDCLQELVRAIHDGLDQLEADAEEHDEDTDWIEAVREDVAECEAWLSQDADRGPRPECPSAQTATELFGGEHRLASWLTTLAASLNAGPV
jgi:hypothetical protein